MVMKHLIFAFAALATLGLSSCSSDEPVAPADECEVTFRVKMPIEIETRAQGDTPVASKLHYAIYQVESDNTLSWVSAPEAADFVNDVAQITQKFAKGYRYQLVFWADSDNGAYTFSSTEAGSTVTVNYDYLATHNNDESTDAFWGKSEVFEAVSDNSMSIELQRPLAQLNIGTSGLDAAEAQALFGTDGADLRTTVSLTDATLYSTLDLVTQSTTGAPVTSLTYDAVPVSAEAYPVTGYSTLAVSYLLPEINQGTPVSSTAQVTLTISNTSTFSKTLPATEVPLQGNHRTNLYSAFLSDLN